MSSTKIENSWENNHYERALEIKKEVESLKLTDTLDNSKREFDRFKEWLSNWEFYYPSFDFPNLDMEKIMKLQKDIANTLKDIPDWEWDTLLEKFYQRLTLFLEKYRIIHQSWNWVLNEEDKKQYLENESEIYPEPPRDLFIHLLTRLQHELAIDIQSWAPELSKRARAFNEIIPTPGRKISYQRPSNLNIVEITNRIGNATEWIEIEDEKKYWAEKLAWFFKTALNNLWIIEWIVEIREGSKTAIAVDPSLKKIYIPSTRSIKWCDIRKKIAHEISVHVLRWKNWVNSWHPFLWVWVWNYIDTEEWIAKIFEEHIEPDSKLPWDLGVLSVGLVLWLDGKPRDFKQLYEIYYAYHAWMTQKEWIKRSDELLVKNSWNRCVRVFSWINPKSKWVCSYKDFSYQKWFTDLVDLLEDVPNSEKSDFIKYLMQWKFDAFDPDVLEILHSIPNSIIELF
jgi:hypothetical protein